MLDIIDIRRQQVMIEGEFPAQLQTAFRGMERAKNPWGINHEKRLDWAEGLNVKTTDQNPTPDVLFWVGCAASYDPQSQKTARAFVQLLDHAGVDFAVLGKRECCTGDSARRAGNEYLYRQLADENVSTLNEIKPKLIVATCPHCLNSVGKEYKQIGGDYKVMHHTEYLETLVSAGKLVADAAPAAVTYHDPCYLGRHNGIYEAPRNLLNILSNDVVELPRNRENSFCCGAGGAQFWKEEEPGDERISDNRYREAQTTLASATGEEKVLAVGCPFCKSMLESTPGKGETPVAVRDVAELLLEGVQRKSGKFPAAQIGAQPAVMVAPLPEVVTTPVVVSAPSPTAPTLADAPSPAKATLSPESIAVESIATPGLPERKKWSPKAPAPAQAPTAAQAEPSAPLAEPTRQPEPLAQAPPQQATPLQSELQAPVSSQPEPPRRKAWGKQSGIAPVPSATPPDPAPAVDANPSPAPLPAVAPAAEQAENAPVHTAPARKAWNPKKAAETAAPAPVEAAAQNPVEAAPTEAPPRKRWVPKAASKPEENSD